MKVTFIIKDVSEAFFEGVGSSIKGLNNMDDREKFTYLNKTALEKCLNIKMKIGNDSFRDRVELNQTLRNVKSLSYKIEPRKGYKLATFEIA